MPRIKKGSYRKRGKCTTGRTERSRRRKRLNGREAGWKDNGLPIEIL